MRYFPLYEAKMFHQFDHRWATFDGVEGDAEETEADAVDLLEGEEEEEGGGDKVKTRDCTLAEKQDPSFLPTPRYWVSEADVLLRAVPLSREEKEELEELDPELIVELLRPRAPQWLIALRDITNTTNERTAIISALPLVGAGHNAPIIHLRSVAEDALCFVAMLDSLVCDWAIRQKVGGTHLSLNYLHQIAVLPLDWTPDLRRRGVALALELVYTSDHLRSLAEACGFDGPPFLYDEDRRARVRAELDALVARLYGLNRKQLRYILCPQGLSWAELENINDGWEDPTCSGPHLLPAEPALDFPGETFRVLKDKEEKKYGEYRTRRLVLEAWDRLWDELGPVEPLPIRFGPHAPGDENSVQEARTPYGAVEQAPGRLFDVPISTGLFAESALPPDPTDETTP